MQGEGAVREACAGVRRAERGGAGRREARIPRPRRVCGETRATATFRPGKAATAGEGIFLETAPSGDSGETSRPRPAPAIRVHKDRTQV